MKKIPLTQGYFALVDDEDYGLLSQLNWNVRISGTTCYAKTNFTIKAKELGLKSCLMHRFILGLTNSKDFVDHMDGNGLNNQRKNLRICSRAENCRNRNLGKNNAVGFKGVCKESRGRYRSYISVNRKLIILGWYDSPEEAARHYNKAAIQHHGKFARLNKVVPLYPLSNEYERVKSKSGFFGVFFNKKRKKLKWRAKIYHHKEIHIGYFDTAEDAAKAYNRAALKHHGKKAKLNKV